MLASVTHRTWDNTNPSDYQFPCLYIELGLHGRRERKRDGMLEWNSEANDPTRRAGLIEPDHGV